MLQGNGSNWRVSCSQKPLRMGTEGLSLSILSDFNMNSPQQRNSSNLHKGLHNCKQLSRGISDFLSIATQWKRYWPWHEDYSKYLTTVTAWADTGHRHPMWPYQGIPASSQVWVRHCPTWTSFTAVTRLCLTNLRAVVPSVSSLNTFSFLSLPFLGSSYLILQVQLRGHLLRELSRAESP